MNLAQRQQFKDNTTLNLGGEPMAYILNIKKNIDVPGIKDLKPWLMLIYSVCDLEHVAL